MQPSIDVVVATMVSCERREERKREREKTGKKIKKSGDGRTYAIEIMISLVEEEKEKTILKAHSVFQIARTRCGKGCQDFTVN